MADEKREVLLKVDHLCQYFKMDNKSELKAVHDVSFDVYKGEVFGIVGESGCGKTTTGRTIIKLYNATSGSVYFKGQRICAGTRSYTDAIKQAKKELKEFSKANSGNSELVSAKREETKKFIAEQQAQIKSAKFDHKNCDKVYSVKHKEELKKKYEPLIAAAEGEQKAKLEKKYKNEMQVARKGHLVTQIQMIFQDPIASLDPRMTVKEIIAEGLKIKGVKDQEYIDEKVYEVLERIGLVREHAGRYPHEFSGGQRQRIGVARSIVMEPELIIADEPVSALDVSIQAQVLNLINDLRNEFGITIVFIAHDLSVVKYFSDRIGVMYYGDLVELTTSKQLFDHPLHPYTRSLLSAIPLPDPVYEKKRKRITYNPLVEHDYSSEEPTMREVEPGHFVRCNTAEFDKYVEELKK